MTLGPIISTAELAEFRAEAESRMRGTCRITRIDPDAEPEVDEDGVVTHPTTEVYEGKYYCRYPGLAFEQNPESGGASLAISKLVVRIPFGPITKPGDIITILSDPDNPQLVGTVLRVASIDDQSQATAQRLLVDDYQSGQIG